MELFLCQQNTVQVLGQDLTIFEWISLAKTCKTFYRQIIQQNTIASLILTKLQTKVNKHMDWKYDNCEHGYAGDRKVVYPSETGKVSAEQVKSLLESFEEDDENAPLSKLGKVAKVVKPISEWTLEEKLFIRSLCLTVLNQEPLWLTAYRFDPRFTRISDKQYKNVITPLKAVLKNPFLRHDTECKPKYIKSKKALGKLTKDQVKYNTAVSEFKQLREHLTPTKTVEENLQCLYLLLSRTQAIQTGANVSLAIRINPRDPNAKVTFSSGKTMRIPTLRLGLYNFRIDNQVTKHLKITGSYHNKYADTNGLFCFVEPNGTVIPTVNFWWAQVGEFLQELNNDIFTNMGLIGKICNACVFCGRTLSDTESLHKGFGSTCEKKFGLHHFRDMQNSVISGSSGTVRNAVAAKELAIDDSIRLRPETIKTLEATKIEHMDLTGSNSGKSLKRKAEVKNCVVVKKVCVC